MHHLVRGATLIALVAATAALAQPPRQELPRDVRDARALLAAAPKAALSLGAMRIDLALPDAATGFYLGSRFDWSGIVTGVTVGRQHFYGLWFDGIADNVRDFTYDGDAIVVGPNTAAMGPAEEFLSGPTGASTLGYDETPVGGTFLKLGVGRLLKEDAQLYNRFRSYRIASGTAWQVRKTARAITFRQRIAPDAGGYGYDYVKTIRIEPGNVMVIDHTLTNTGNRVIDGQVYNHNFTRFGDGPMGPDIKVDFKFPVTAKPAPDGSLAVAGSTLRYLKAMTGADRIASPIEGFSAYPATSGFAITGGPDAARIDVAGDAPLIKVALWSIRTVVAIEPFIAIHVAPGATQRWSWRYHYTPKS